MVREAVREVTDVPEVDASLLTAVDGFPISGINRFDLEIHPETRPAECMLGGLRDAANQSKEKSETPAIASVGIDSRPVVKTAVAGGLFCMPGIGPVRQVSEPRPPLRFLSAKRPQKSIPVPHSFLRRTPMSQFHCFEKLGKALRHKKRTPKGWQL